MKSNLNILSPVVEIAEEEAPQNIIHKWLYCKNTNLNLYTKIPMYVHLFPRAVRYSPDICFIQSSMQDKILAASKNYCSTSNLWQRLSLKA